MTTYNTLLGEEFYISIAKGVATYFKEKAKTGFIPMINTEKSGDDIYRHLRFDNAINTGRGVSEYSEEGPRAQVPVGYDDFRLARYQMDLRIPKVSDNVVEYQLSEQKRQVFMRDFALNVDVAMLNGIYDDTGAVLLASGLKAQALDSSALGLGKVQDLAGGASNLATKGYGWAAIKKLIDTVPYEYRENASPMKLISSENFISRMRAPDRIYQDKIEWDFIYEEYMGPKAIPGRKIDEVIITNNILDTQGLDAADTLGTNDRLMLVVPDSQLLGRVTSKGFHLVGEKELALSLHQIWGWKGRCCLFNKYGALYSEQIVWA